LFFHFHDPAIGSSILPRRPFTPSRKKILHDSITSTDDRGYAIEGALGKYSRGFYLNAVRGLAGLEVADIFRLHGAAYRFSQYGAIGSDTSADPWSLYIFPGIRYGRFQVAAVCGHVLSRIRGKI